LHEIYWTIGLAIVFVCLIILLFLGSFRAAIVPIATIPVCLFGTIGLLYVADFSLNSISLLALVLSIGLIVDDAIVVLENTFRHTELGTPPRQAALNGSRQINGPIIAMSLTLLAVFAPIMFIDGPVSAFIKAFAFALAGSVLLSGFVALTLSPAMCAYLLPKQQSTTGYAHKLQGFFKWLDSLYLKVLNFCLNVRVLVILFVICCAVYGAFVYQSIPKSYFPKEDTGVVEVYLTPQPGANLMSLREQLHSIYQKIKSIRAIKNIALNADTGFSQPFAHFYIGLLPRNQRKLSAAQVAMKINTAIKNLPGVSAYAQADNSGPIFQHDVEFSVLSPTRYSHLASIVQAVSQRLRSYPGLTHINNDMKFDNQQYVLTIDQAMAGQLNVSNQNIINALSIFLGGINSNTKFVLNNKLYDIVLQAGAQYQQEISAIKRLYVQNNDGKMVSLGSVVNVKLQNTMPTLQHYNLLRAGSVFGQIAPHYSMGKVIHDLQHILPKLLPSGVHYAFTNAARIYQQSNHDSVLLFSIALLCIYLVLAALFESFVDPLTILLGVPLCIISALIAIRYLGGSLNIYTQIGLVTLVGLIAKHGILITQFANQLQKQGAELQAAISQAALMRLRPILMTTLAMIMGAIPLLLASGAGANARHQLGIVIVFGLLFGTFFSLVVVPVAYTLLDRLKPSH
jgi:multidrug efflux pump subunit AcrB